MFLQKLSILWYYIGMNENALTLNEAIELYKNGHQVYTCIQSRKTYLFLIKDKYILKNGETALYLTYKELDELFGKANYFEDENVEEIVDPLKDQEYYSWRQ